MLRKVQLFYCCFFIWTIQAISIQEQWNQFKHEHGKSYRSLIDHQIRFRVFQNNLLKIQEHNKKYEQGEIRYKMGVNQFSDLTQQEFVSRLKFNGNPKENPQLGSGEKRIFRRNLNYTAPGSVDWRLSGAVTKVKNQGICGSCWTFSSTGALEGQHFLATGELLSLSEQNLVDCAGSAYENAGCNGGLMDGAFQFVRDYGIETEESYPYEGHNDICQFNSSLSVLKISGYVDVEANEEALEAAVAKIGPISIAVDATFMQFYADGIYEDYLCSAENLNHGVLAVGYGTDSHGQAYWIVKNSWGESYGENGYIRMVKGSNQCGIATLPSYPVL